MVVLVVAENCAFCMRLHVRRIHAEAVRTTRGIHPNRAEPTSVMRALLVSSFGKMLVLLLVLWEYALDMIHVMNLFVVTSNVAAIMALLSCKFHSAVLLVLIPYSVRTLLQMALSVSVGLPAVLHRVHAVVKIGASHRFSSCQ